MKALITEPTLTVEAKYQNAVQAPNFVHLMMASNEDWVVPAGPEARRFLVLLTEATKAKDRKYFSAIWTEMENGGYEAMLHELQHRDLTNFNVRDVPQTEGLQEQKKLSLGTTSAWWIDVLHRGYVFKSRLGLEAIFGNWHPVIATDLLYESYIEFAKAKHERHPISREALCAYVVKMGGQSRRPAGKQIYGEHITDVITNQYGDTQRRAVTMDRDRPPSYHLGSLEEARASFYNETKLSVNWDDKGTSDNTGADTALA